MKSYLLVLSMLSGLLLSGCVSNQMASLMPGSEPHLLAAQTYYVVHLPVDNRRVDHMIVNELRSRGLNATGVEPGEAPADADVVITYQDKWMWDMSMYMMELRIQFRDSETEGVLVSGQSTRSSLVRKTPEGMIDEVLNQIFAKFQPKLVQDDEK